jgi:hypothetical protein
MQLLKELPARNERHNEVEIGRRLERVPQVDEERMVDLRHDVALGLQVRHRLVLDHVLLGHDLPESTESDGDPAPANATRPAPSWRGSRESNYGALARPGKACQCLPSSEQRRYL